MSRTVPLLFQVSAADPRPLTRQIVDAVRRQIAVGELAVGDQLPSVRALAQQLTLNPNTVARAYSELTNEGWLDARQGLGLFVAAPRQRLSADERERRLAQAIDTFTGEVIGLDFPLEDLLGRIRTSLTPLLHKRIA